MRSRLFAALAFLSCLQFLRAASALEMRDVVVYGGTSGGVAAALQAARMGRTVVLIEPNEVALRLAVQIAVPTLGLLVVILGIVSAVGVVIARSITRPLEGLLAAAKGIGQGDLGQEVVVTGEDEIGQLGSAIEQMRVHLKNRLEEQERLLKIGRAHV